MDIPSRSTMRIRLPKPPAMSLSAMNSSSTISPPMIGNVLLMPAASAAEASKASAFAISLMCVFRFITQNTRPSEYFGSAIPSDSIRVPKKAAPDVESISNLRI